MPKTYPPGITAEEVSRLGCGVAVWVRWSGGNGPHRYIISRVGSVVFVTIEGRLGYELSFVGPLQPFTQVWLSDPQASAPADTPPAGNEHP